MTILINETGDLRLESRRLGIIRLIQQFESSDNSMIGVGSTTCWIKNYVQHLQLYNRQNVFTYKFLITFLRLSDNRRYMPTILTNKSACKLDLPECVQAFYCKTSFHNVTSYSQRTIILKKWRAIANTHKSTFNVSINYYESSVLDQIASVRAITTSSVAISVII